MNHLLTPSELEGLKGLQFSLPRLFERGMAGRHQTSQQGSSVEFSQHRDYAAGDPIRHIDWKAFARSEKFVVKEFESESNLQVVIAVDCSGSMAFKGSAPISKSSFACKIAHGLSWLLLNQGDAVGIVSFSDESPEYLPPLSTGGQLHQIESMLQRMKPKSQTHFDQLTNFINARCRRNTVCIVITDFLDESESNAQNFIELKRRRYPTYCLHVLSPNEYALAEQDPTVYLDEERNTSILSEPEAIKQTYDTLILEWINRISAECRHHGVPYELALSDTLPVALIRRLVGGIS